MRNRLRFARHPPRVLSGLIYSTHKRSTVQRTICNKLVGRNSPGETSIARSGDARGRLSCFSDSGPIALRGIIGLWRSDARRGYRHAIDKFVEWYGSEPLLAFSKTGTECTWSRAISLQVRSILPVRASGPDNWLGVGRASTANMETGLRARPFRLMRAIRQVGEPEACCGVQSG